MTNAELIAWAKPERVLLAEELADGGLDRYLALVRELLAEITPLRRENPTTLELMCACDVAANLWAIQTDGWTVRAERESIKASYPRATDRLKMERIALAERLDKREAHRLAIGMSLGIVREVAAHRVGMKALTRDEPKLPQQTQKGLQTDPASVKTL